MKMFSLHHDVFKFPEYVVTVSESSFEKTVPAFFRFFDIPEAFWRRHSSDLLTLLLQPCAPLRISHLEALTRVRLAQCSNLNHINTYMRRPSETATWSKCCMFSTKTTND